MHPQVMNMDLQEGMEMYIIYITRSKTFTWGHVSVFDKYFTVV